MKGIAVDKADFEGIIKNNLIYVDKTKYLYNIIGGSTTYFFMSRPRRFGKSLTINTLKAIFEGKKELFKDLYIYNTDWKWEQYPVIHLDFNAIPRNSKEEMEQELSAILYELAKKNDIIIEKKTATLIFPELVKKLYEKYDKGVVFLVDEYDKPIVSFLGEDNKTIETAKENRDFMKIFYDNLKPLEPYLKTVFITGVSKFSKVSIFSTLNNLIELDTHIDYADMLGYTESELDVYFIDYFQDFSRRDGISFSETRERFRKMYNGFRFTEKEIRVYNPFSIGRAFFYKQINNYWFASGTPTFLINLIKANNYDFTKITKTAISDEDIRAYDIENLNINALLYQTGYLTIKEFRRLGDNRRIKLGFPNKEVENGFYNQLLKSYLKPDFSTAIIFDIKDALLNKDFDKVIETVKSIYAGIPYIIQPGTSKKIKLPEMNLLEYEFYYHSIFYIILTLSSDNELKIGVEVMTSDGRIDCVIELPDDLYIIEFKCNHSADEAIQQIKDKKYYEKYTAKYQNINLIGINFSSEKRNIDDWKIEVLEKY